LPGGVGSVALALGSELLIERNFTGDLRHAGELLVTMDELTRQQGWAPGDIEHLYVSAGPGSFTGIRIAITAAKTLAFAQPTRIIAVPSIEAQVLNADLATREQNIDIKTVGVVLEAGRGQIYAAVFEKIVDDNSAEGILPGFRTVIKQAMMSPADLLTRSRRPLYLLGEGLKYHREELTADEVIWLDEKYSSPKAAFVHRCGYLRARAGLFADVDRLVPIYIRRPEAVEKWEKLHGP